MNSGPQDHKRSALNTRPRCVCLEKLETISTYQDTRARLNITKVATMLSNKNKLQITTNAMLRISNISVKTYKNEEKAI